MCVACDDDRLSGVYDERMLYSFGSNTNKYALSLFSLTLYLTPWTSFHMPFVVFYFARAQTLTFFFLHLSSCLLSFQFVLLRFFGSG